MIYKVLPCILLGIFWYILVIPNFTKIVDPGWSQVPLTCRGDLRRFEGVLSVGRVTAPTFAKSRSQGHFCAKLGHCVVGRADISTKAHSPASKFGHRRGQYSVSLFILPPL